MKKTFTLIELIVVIAIIAILAAIIAPNAFRAIEKAKITRAIGDFKTIKSATMSYYSDCGQWPLGDIATVDLNGNDITNETQNFITGENQPSGWDGPYLERWPQNHFTLSGRPYSAQRYPRYIYDCFPNPFTDNPGEGVIYLDAFHCPTEVAQTIKQKIDGTNDLGPSDYADQTGFIRWHYPANYLYYVIIEGIGCP